MKAVAQIFNEGDRACEEQATPSVGLISHKPSANEWSCIQNNNNNEYYLSLADGSYNNNNKNNTYWVVPVESEEICELVFKAEEDCWSNKHSSWDANKYHYHAGRRIWQFIKALVNRTYAPWKSYCFVVMHPKPREIFAAHYQDRIAHHIIAPYLTAVSEAVHKKNGDVSFGNRKKMSSYHACLRVQKLMREHRDGYIFTMDLQGYFMSINRDVAWDIFCKFEEEYRPSGYTDSQRNFIMWLAEILIKSDPSANCEKRSPDWLWEQNIKPHKSLFGNNGNGLPIGNYYAQIIANLIPELICEQLAEYNPTEFVDDFACIVDHAYQINEARDIMDSALAKLKLKRNKKKVYAQPVRHGVLWCGHMIYADRMYTSNRIIHNCERKMRQAIEHPSIYAARRLQQTVNSYFGMMRHASEYKAQRRIADMIEGSPYHEWLYFEEGKGFFVCKVKKKYQRTVMSGNVLEEINNYHKNQTNMIVIPVKKGAKHYQRKIDGFVYRYGYQPIAGEEDYVSAAVEETRTRLKEADIRKRVTAYCASVGIPNEYDPSDYGY